MTYKEIAQMIESIGLPFAYYSFPEKQAPPLPYIVFNYPSNDDFGADNTNYKTIVNLDIELYTVNKDFDHEETVEDVLKANRLFYAKSQGYLDSEQMYEVLYEMQIPIEGEVLNG